MSTNYLNNENKTNLLFKKFEGVAQSGLITDDTTGKSFSLEPKKVLNNVYQQDIFSENVPVDLSFTLADMRFNTGGITIPDSSWNTTAADQTLSYIDLSGASFGQTYPLRFYKRVYLEPMANTSQAWWLLDPSGDGTASSNNNLLKDMIPFLYNDINPDTYTPIIERWNGSNWITTTQATSTGDNWAIDPATGAIQFYQSTSILNGLNLDHIQTTEETKRPRISFIKYSGTKGSSGGGSGGTLAVGDFSNNTHGPTTNVNTMYFDASGFDLSFNGNDVIVSNTGTGSSLNSGIADISYYFFDIPLTPIDGSGVLDNTTNGGTIKLQWTNPSNIQTAVPYGHTLGYADGSNITISKEIERVPYHRKLNLQGKILFSSFSSEIIPGFQNGWIDLSINKPTQTVIPPTVNNAWLTYNGTTTDLCGNLNPNVDMAPYQRYTDTTTLKLGRGYQFRVFMDNSGISNPTGYPPTDPVYGGDVSWNYLYIPDVSGAFIALGDFGPAIRPTGITGYLPTYNKFDISMSTSNDADASLNTPFPISNALSLAYAFGADISGSVSNISIQNNTSRYDTLYPSNYPFDTSYQTPFQKQNKVLTPYSEFIQDISACPEFIYEIGGVDGFWGVNNAFPDDLSYAAAPFDDFFILPRPTRDEAITTYPEYRTELTGNTLLDFIPGDVSMSNAYPATNNSIINGIHFFSDAQSTTFTGSDTIRMSNNPSLSLIGTDGSGKTLSSISIDVSGTTGIRTDSSNNPTIGYLQTTNTILDNSVNFDVSAISEEAGQTPIFQNQGYYTGLKADALLIKDVSLVTYPDISNIGYNPYVYTLNQYYNDSAGPVQWVKASGERTFDFNVGKKPLTDTSFSVISYTNPDPSGSLTNSLFGLKRPNPAGPPISVDYSYNIYDLDPTWRRELTLTNVQLDYHPNPSVVSIVDGPDSFSWLQGGSTNQDINPLLNIQNTFFKTTQQYSRTYSVDPQFEVNGTYSNNVIRTPSNFNMLGQDVSFGNPGKYLWWDFTWDGASASGLIATTKPSSGFTSINAMNNPGVDSSGSSFWFPDNSAVFFQTYDHTQSTPFNQLMWANGGFRSGQQTYNSGSNNPYYDFSSNFYNPSLVLNDYSLLGSSGEDISYSLPSGTYYNGSINVVPIQGIYKWVNLAINNVPSIGPYTITINGGISPSSSSTLTQGQDYLLFVCEKSSLYTVAGGYPYDGRSGWMDAQKKQTASNPFAGSADGQGCWVIGFPSNGVKVWNASSGNPSTIFLRIGLKNTITNQYISSVSFST